MERFNQLTPAQAERLAILSEECGEVIQAIGKILRHGYASIDPTGQKEGSNRQQLERELGDIKACITIMHDAGDVMGEEIYIAAQKKLKKLDQKQYSHHQ